MARLDLHIHGVQSLKQKRSAVARLINRIRSHYPVSVAEVGCLDLLQRSVLGISMTAGEEKLIASTFINMENDVYKAGIAEIVAFDIEYINYGDESR